jgi:YwiC-like protein
MKLPDIIPREHGTWAMWIVPMLSAMLVTHFSARFVLLFVCFALFYLAHRPILTLIKDRHRLGVEKFLLMVTTPAIVLAVFIVAAYRLPWLILFWGIELSLFVFSVKTFVRKDQRNFINELTILSALTLTAPAAYYTITGRIDEKVVQLFILNFLFFGGSVLYVKARIELLRSKGKLTNEVRKSRIAIVLYYFILVAVVVLLYVFGSVSLLMLLGFVPMLLQVASGMSSNQTKVNFVRVGVALTAQSVIFLVGVRLFLN